MRNIRLTLAYDGTNYVGWQVQPNGVSVQSVVAAAIEKLTGESPTLLAAGRTDAGVHALGQVANFRTNTAIPCENIRAGLQSYLPHDIAVREAVEVPECFHATHSAVRKRYRYVIHNSRVRNPLLRNYVWQVHEPLDVVAMHEAGQALVGTHDFRAFESHFPNKATSVRSVMELAVSRHDEWSLWSGSREAARPHGEEGPFISFEICADGFLYNMVRAITGTLVDVGRGRSGIDDVKRILESQHRSQAGPTAPSQGLYLVSVDYAE
jgi:tRNA pseudouridine38-40 synthase